MASFLERLRSRFICIKYVQTDNAEEHMELKEGLLQNTEGLKRFLHGYQAGIEIKVYKTYGILRTDENEKGVARLL